MGATSRQVWLWVLAGCGRIQFDELADARSDGTAMVDAFEVVPTRCGETQVMICDGFEQPMFDPRWSVSGTGGMTAMDPTRAYRGNSSVHFHTDAAPLGNPSALLRTTQGLGGAITGTIHMRAWVYLESPYPMSLYNQVLNVVNAASTGVSMGSLNGFARSNDYVFQQSRVSTTVNLPVDRWTCLQLEVPSNLEGLTKVFVDGVEALDAELVTPVGSPQPAADHLYVGLDWVTGMAVPATDTWLDELIVDTQPTTCAQ